MYRITALVASGVLVSFPFVVLAAPSIPEEYRDEIRAVLLSGDISADIDATQFEQFVDVLAQKAYNANVTGADLTEARVESLLAAAAGFDGTGTSQPVIREPNVSVLWGSVAGMLLVIIISRYYRRLHNGGALGHVAI
ncbi:hypothetical protein HY413_02975 [Candidatus Kaiserbacteria bacterium]|nr:hypothetical protein [Candidatus Kaiserbacteria bacterium]